MSGTAKSKGRRVVALQADYNTKTALRDWAVKAGFDLGWSYSGWPQSSDFFDFHVTILATSNDVAIDPRASSVDPLRLKVKGFGRLGEGADTPALMLEASDTLSAIRDLFLGLGCEPTYAEYLPHVSLSYRWQGSPALDTLALPDFPLVFDWLVVSELDSPAVAAVGDAAPSAFAAVFRDSAKIAGTRKTADGYLVTEACVARTGIQDYAGFEVGRPDAPLVRVYRPEAEVFSRDAMSTYAFRPVTVGHPAEGVTADNWRKEAVGNTGGEIARDGDFVRVPLVVMDAAAIASIEGGVREISMGYDCVLDFTPGTTPDGRAYDAVQRCLRMNHLALVERGRAGPACRVGDGVRPKQGPDKTEEVEMKKITVDGIGYEVSEQAAELVAKLQGDVKAARDAATAATADRDAAIKSRDAAIGERDAIKSTVPTADALDALVAARAACIDAAKRLCPDVATDGVALDAIRAAVVKSKLGDTAVTNRSADYIAAAFDTLAGGTGGPDKVADALTSGSKSAPADTAAKARDEYLKRTADAWRGTAAA